MEDRPCNEVRIEIKDLSDKVTDISLDGIEARPLGVEPLFVPIPLLCSFDT